MMSVWLQRGHRWLGLIVGTQLLLWLLSGLVMALLPQAEVDGSARFDFDRSAGVYSANAIPAFAALLTHYPAVRLRLIDVGGRLLAEVNTTTQHLLVDPQTNATVTLGSADIAVTARQHWQGAEAMQPPVLEAVRTLENRDYALPVWRVDFATGTEDRLYLDGVTGRVLGASNNWSRLFDVFWMLHIMDYRARSDFNHPLLIGAAAGAVMLAFSGAWLLLPTVARFGRRLIARNRVRIQILTSGKLLHQQSVPSGSNLLAQLLQAGYPLPSTCGGGGSCGRCRLTLAPDAVISNADREWLSPGALAQGERLACQHWVRADLSLDLPTLPAPGLSAVLVAREFLSPTLFSVRLQLAEPLTFAPGDHVMLHCPSFEQAWGNLDIPGRFSADWHAHGWYQHVAYSATALSRAYSIASATDSPTELQLLVRLVAPGNRGVSAGRGSSYLAGIPLGTRVSLSGPYGDFHVRAGKRPLLLIAGGSGLAPIRSMIHDLRRVCCDPRPIDFWYGARTQQDCVYADEFACFTQQPGFRFHPVLSDEPIGSSWTGRAGWLHEALASGYDAAQLRTMDIYLCGPPVMIAAIQQVLQRAGVASEHVAIDAYS